MKYSSLYIFLFLVFLTFSANSQEREKHWEIEVGGGMNFAQGKALNADNRIGRDLYVEARYLFINQHLSLGFQINQSQFNRKFYGSGENVDFYSASATFSSLGLMLTSRYTLPVAKKLDLNIGVGAGCGIVSDKGTIQMEGNEYYSSISSGSGGPTFLIAPKLGITINKHFNIDISYKFQEKSNRMALLSVGYAFRL